MLRAPAHVHTKVDPNCRIMSTAVQCAQRGSQQSMQSVRVSKSSCPDREWTHVRELRCLPGISTFVGCWLLFLGVAVSFSLLVFEYRRVLLSFLSEHTGSEEIFHVPVRDVRRCCCSFHPDAAPSGDDFGTVLLFSPGRHLVCFEFCVRVKTRTP